MSATAYIYEAVRTPFGRHGGALAGIRPDDLAAHALRALLDRTDLDPARIDDVIMGNANGAGEENRDVARMALLLAGLPTSIPGVTVNRLCGSSLEATIQAARSIHVGDASILVAGGVESMSRAPWVLLKPEKGFPARHEKLHSTTLGWRIVNPRMPDQWTISLGATAEKLAGMYGITREEQDEFALRSHRLAARAFDHGVMTEVVPVPGIKLERDESIRTDTSIEKLALLEPAFVDGGTVTAGNSSPLNDGAAMLLLGDEAAAEAIGGAPLARIVSAGLHAVDPDVFGIAPVEASNKALPRRAELGRHRRSRAQRGVRVTVALLPARLARARPRQAQPGRRRDRDRPPARRLGRAHHRPPRQRAALTRPLRAGDDLHRRRPRTGDHPRGDGRLSNAASGVPDRTSSHPRDSICATSRVARRPAPRAISPSALVFGKEVPVLAGSELTPTAAATNSPSATASLADACNRTKAIRQPGHDRRERNGDI
jgi:acetyl-CoA acetyltransferase family protein